jgi:hypothetical protein
MSGCPFRGAPDLNPILTDLVGAFLLDKDALRK